MINLRNTIHIFEPKIIILNVLPGHSPRSQLVSSSYLPGHTFPPFDAGGLLQCRIRDFFPAPQDVLHSPQTSHEDQTPSTGKRKDHLVFLLRVQESI